MKLATYYVGEEEFLAQAVDDVRVRQNRRSAEERFIQPLNSEMQKMNGGPGMNCIMSAMPMTGRGEVTLPVFGKTVGAAQGSQK